MDNMSSLNRDIPDTFAIMWISSRMFRTSNGTYWLCQNLTTSCKENHFFTNRLIQGESLSEKLRTSFYCCQFWSLYITFKNIFHWWVHEKMQFIIRLRLEKILCRFQDIFSDINWIYLLICAFKYNPKSVVDYKSISFIPLITQVNAKMHFPDQAMVQYGNC